MAEGVRRNGNGWRARVRLVAPDTGKKTEIGKTFVTHDEAVAWRDDQRARMRKGMRPNLAWRDRTVAEWVREWIENHPRTNNKSSTRENHASILRKWVLGEGKQPDAPSAPPLASVKLRDLEPTDIIQFRNSLPTKGTVRFRVDRSLGACLLDAEELGVIERTPFRSKKFRTKYKPVRRLREKYWKEGEAAAFLASLDDSMHVGWSKRKPSVFTGLADACYVLLNTGMRIGELLALRWEAVDLDNALLTVERGGNPDDTDEYDDDEVKAENSERTMELDEATVAVLREHLLRQRAELLASGLRPELVFCYSDGAPISYEAFEGWWNAAVEASGERRVTINGTRHTHAVLLLTEGWDIFYVAQRLGNSVAVCEKNYARLIPGGVRNRVYSGTRPRTFSEIVAQAGT